MGFPPRRKAPQSSGQLKQLVQLQAPTSAYHPYQTVHRNGISNEQTVVMMYDNLTQNEVNLKPGITENKWKVAQIQRKTFADFQKAWRNAAPDHMFGSLEGKKEMTWEVYIVL